MAFNRTIGMLSGDPRGALDPNMYFQRGQQLGQQMGQSLGMLAGRDMRTGEQIAQAEMNKFKEVLTDPNATKEILAQTARAAVQAGYPEVAGEIMKKLETKQAAEAAAAKDARDYQLKLEELSIKQGKLGIEQEQLGLQRERLEVEKDRYALDVEKFKAPKEEKMSNYGLMLTEAGYSEGTEAYETEMRKYLARLQKAESVQIREQSPTEKRKLLNEDLRNTAQYKSYEDASNKLVKIQELAGSVQKGNPKAIRVLERSVSELYNSDSRAASEIDRFLTGKGIYSTIGDYLLTLADGDVTEDTKRDIAEVVAAAERAASINKIQAVVTTAQTMGGVMDEASLIGFLKAHGIKPLDEAPPKGIDNKVVKDANGNRVYVWNGVAYEI